MELQRKDVANKFYGKHTEINTENKESVINYLNELDNYLNSCEYESNSDFIFCGRKKFVYDEIIEIMNGIKSVDNPVYFVLGSLEEFLSNNNTVYMSDSDVLGISWNELRDANDRYISTGVICLEEVEMIRDIIKRIINQLGGSSVDNEIQSSIPESLRGFVYFYNDEVYPKQKLPKELEEEFKNFKESVNKNINKVDIELPNLIEKDNYKEAFNEENAKFVSVLNNRGMFHLSISSGAVLPVTHPKYYEGRKHIVLDKDLENNYVSRQEVEIEKDKYNVNESIIDEVIEYIKTNFNKLLEVAANQNMEMYDGVSHNINIKLGSIYLMLSPLNVKTEEDKLFLNNFEKKIMEILTAPMSYL